MSLVLVGLSHRTASLPVREGVVYSPEEAVSTLRELKRADGAPQALLLSTCNRTELYAIVSDPDAWLPSAKERLFLSRHPGHGFSEEMLYTRTGAQAVEHLFRVATGLDSQVLGEQEILHQVKTAYELSRSAETVGTVFHRLAARAFHVGKRARTETQIGLGAVSVAFAAVELAEKVFQSLRGRGALLVGAGENGALCAQHLASRGVEPLLITNRTLAKADEVATRLGGETVPFENWVQALQRVDVLVTTTGATETLIGRAEVQQAMQRREGRPLVIIDIAVPRDVDPAVDGLGNVFRFDMDSLGDIVSQTLAKRQDEVPRVEQLVDLEVSQFMRWWSSLASGPVIRDLNRAFDAVRTGEFERNAKRFQEGDRQQLDVFSRNLVRKLLINVTTEIKGYRPSDPVEMERLAALRRVFGLDDESDEEKSDAE